jgi:hypothetical protein
MWSVCTTRETHIFGQICWWDLGHHVYPGLIIKRFITDFYSRCCAVLNGPISRVDKEYCPALDMRPPKGSSEYGSRLSGMDICPYMEGFFRRSFDGKTKSHMKYWYRYQVGCRWKRFQSLSDAFSDTLMFSRIILASGVSTNLVASQSYSTYRSSHRSIQQSENSSRTFSRSCDGYRGLIFTRLNVLNEASPQTETVGTGVDRDPR